MKTSSLRTYKGPGRIVISRSTRGASPAGYRVFKALAPGDYFRTASKEEYIKLFEAQLAKLDPVEVWERLHDLADGHEPVLLCYEVPPFTETNWCHRRMVANWFERELGHKVEELVI